VTSRRIPRASGFLLCISLVLAHGSGWAQEREISDAELKEYESLLSEGAQKFQAGQYGEARGSLERAYAIYPNPVIQFSIAGTYRREKKNDEALEHYRRFLDECSGEVCRAENEQQVAIAEKTIAELEPAKPQPPVGLVPALEPKGETDVEPTRDPGWLWRRVGIGVGVTGVVLVGLAGVEQLRASGVESDIEDELAANGNMWTQALADREDDGKGMELRARIFAVTGVVAVGAGVGIYYYGHLLGGDSKAVAIAPLVGTEPGLVVSGTF